MMRVFSYLFVFSFLSVISFFSLLPRTTFAEEVCTIESSFNAQYGKPYEVRVFPTKEEGIVKIAGGSTATYNNIAYSELASKEYSNTDAKPVTFQFSTELPPSAYKFTAYIYNKGDDKHIIGQCTTKSSMSLVDSSGNQPPSGDACYVIINSQCTNICSGSNQGIFTSEETCNTYLKENIHVPPPESTAFLYPTIKVPENVIPCTEDHKCKTAIGEVDASSATSIISSLFRWIIGIAAFSLIVLLIYAGYKILTSRGDQEKIAGARETITSAIIGFIFILLSFAILEIIGVDILQLPGFSR